MKNMKKYKMYEFDEMDEKKLKKIIFGEIQRVKNKSKKIKSDTYFQCLSMLAGRRDMHDLGKKWKLYPAPSYVDLTFFEDITRGIL